MFILTNHFFELKYKVFYCILSILLNLFVCLSSSPQLTFILAKPYVFLVKNEDFDFIFTNLIEIIEISLIICVCFCLFTNGPICFYFLYTFLKPGLYHFEKLFFYHFLFLFTVNVYLSFICIYFLIFPLSLLFFFSLSLIQNSDFLLIKLTPRLIEYIYIFIKFICFFGLFVFQIPLLFYVLGQYFGIRCYFLFKKRKVLLICNLFVCFLCSPPDLLSLMFFLIPIVILTELSFFVFTLKECYSKIYFRKLLEW